MVSALNGTADQIAQVERNLANLNLKKACGVCFEEYVNNDIHANRPMTAQCGHTYCFTCLSRVPSCPECRELIVTSHRDLNTVGIADAVQSVTNILACLRGLRAEQPEATEVVAATEVATAGQTWINSPEFNNSISDALAAINATATVKYKALTITFDSAENLERGVLIFREAFSLWEPDFLALKCSLLLYFSREATINFLTGFLSPKVSTSNLEASVESLLEELEESNESTQPEAAAVVAVTEFATSGQTWTNSPEFKQTIRDALAAINATVRVENKVMTIKFDSAENFERGVLILRDLWSLWGTLFFEENSTLTVFVAP